MTLQKNVGVSLVLLSLFILIPGSIVTGIFTNFKLFALMFSISSLVLSIGSLLLNTTLAKKAGKD